MSAPQLNLSISAGTNFSQSFTISNPDSSSTDLTGQTIIARLAKRPGAYDAVASTMTNPVFDYIDFTTSVVDAVHGECLISLTAAETATLQEGKYVYSVVLDDGAGTITEILQGLVTVRPAIGFTTTIGA